MRISAKIMADHIKANLARQSSALMDTQLKLATGKKINRPSDDPVGIGNVLNYRTTLKTIDQYQENILNAKTRIEFTETVLDQVSGFIQTAKNIAVDPDVEDRSVYVNQIQDMRDQLISLANSKYGNDYLFAGHRSDAPAFDETTYAYNGDGGSHPVLIGEGITVDIEADGSTIFTDGGDNLFQVLDDLETALAADPFDRSAVEATIDPLSRIADRVVLSRSNYAADYKRLERVDEHWSTMSNAVETMRERVEDADLTQAALDMQLQQTAYQVLLETAAQVIQPTLVDFLG